MDAEDIKRISSTLNLVATEKIKVAKAGKSKKKIRKEIVISRFSKSGQKR